jgi:hypothetical protein
MKTSNSQISRLKEMLHLEERREAIQNELDNILNKLTSLKDDIVNDSGAALKSIKNRITGAPKSPAKRKPGRPAKSASAKPAAPAARGARRGTRRGALKEKIMQELQTAGAKGITVKDLSEKLSVPYKNLYIWFVTTGKKDPNIKKVGQAKYKLES